MLKGEHSHLIYGGYPVAQHVPRMLAALAAHDLHVMAGEPTEEMLERMWGDAATAKMRYAAMIAANPLRKDA